MGRRRPKVVSRQVQLSPDELVRLAKLLVLAGFREKTFTSDGHVLELVFDANGNEVIVSEELVFVRGRSRDVKKLEKWLMELIEKVVKAKSSVGDNISYM